MENIERQQEEIKYDLVELRKEVEATRHLHKIKTQSKTA